MEVKLPSQLVSKEGTVDLSAFTSTKVLAIYFSAQWCGVCRTFTQELVKFYNEVNKTETQLQILFISSDDTSADFEEHYKLMPWFAVTYDDESREDFGYACKVVSLPHLILIDKDGKVKRDKAHNDIRNNPTKTPAEIFETWKALYEVAEVGKKANEK